MFQIPVENILVLMLGLSFWYVKLLAVPGDGVKCHDYFFFPFNATSMSRIMFRGKLRKINLAWIRPSLQLEDILITLVAFALNTFHSSASSI